jgi:hypothetical protein
MTSHPPKKGLGYKTNLKMLLHQALNSEEKRAGRREPPYREHNLPQRQLMG